MHIYVFICIIEDGVNYLILSRVLGLLTGAEEVREWFGDDRMVGIIC